MSFVHFAESIPPRPPKSALLHLKFCLINFSDIKESFLVLKVLSRFKYFLAEHKKDTTEGRTLNVKKKNKLRLN